MAKHTVSIDSNDIIRSMDTEEAVKALIQSHPLSNIARVIADHTKAGAQTNEFLHGFFGASSGVRARTFFASCNPCWLEDLMPESVKRSIARTTSLAPAEVEGSTEAVAGGLTWRCVKGTGTYADAVNVEAAYQASGWRLPTLAEALALTTSMSDLLSLVRARGRGTMAAWVWLQRVREAYSTGDVAMMWDPDFKGDKAVRVGVKHGTGITVLVKQHG